MEKLAAGAVRKQATPAAAPEEPLPPEYWDSVLKDPRAAVTGAQLRQRHLSEIQRHVLRVNCRRCDRTVEIQTADAVRLYGRVRRSGCRRPTSFADRISPHAQRAPGPGK